MNKICFSVVKLSSVMLTCINLSACIPANDTPSQVAEKYWHAVSTGNHEAARQLVSTESQQSFEQYAALPDADKITISQIKLGDERASVTSTINPVADNNEDNHSFQTQLVMENGQWKIDANHTQIPRPVSSTEKQLEELAEKFSKGFQKNMDSLDSTMSEGMQLLNELVREGSNEMSESMLKGMRDLNENLRESLEEMKQRRDNKTSPDSGAGEGKL